MDVIKIEALTSSEKVYIHNIALRFVRLDGWLLSVLRGQTAVRHGHDHGPGSLGLPDCGRWR